MKKINNLVLKVHLNKEQSKLIVMKDRKIKINSVKSSEIPLESSLGLLAYGDIAFTAWRQKKMKVQAEKRKDEKK